MAEVVGAEMVAEAAESVAEQATTVAEVSRGLSSRDVTLVAAGVGLGIVIGGTVGYFSLKKRLSLKFSDLADKEISEMREHFRAARPVVTAPKPELDALVSDLGYDGSPITADYTPEEAEAIEEANAQAELEAAEELEDAVIEQNVFEEASSQLGNWDYATEMKSRTDGEPYVVHLDEFRENEPMFEQTTLTYFVGDGVLCDVRDKSIDNADDLIGLENLQRFGHGSNDNNVVYVRNEALHMDFEILRSEGKYAHEVHGEIKHSQPRRQDKRRQRFDDDE